MIRRTKYTIYRFSEIYYNSPDSFKSIIASNLTYNELVLTMKIEMLDISDYEPAILITREQEETILEAKRNDNKYERRMQRVETTTQYIEGSTEMEHPESAVNVDFGKLFVEDRRERLDKLTKAFNTLTKIQQQRVYMSIVKEMSTAEIAQIEGKTWHSVDESLKSAYRKLKKHM